MSEAIKPTPGPWRATEKEGSSAIKVIKQGKLPEEQIHRETCGHCKSELEFIKHSEVLWSPDPRDGALWFVICPVCTRHVWGRSK